MIEQILFFVIFWFCNMGCGIRLQYGASAGRHAKLALYALTCANAKDICTVVLHIDAFINKFAILAQAISIRFFVLCVNIFHFLYRGR